MNIRLLVTGRTTDEYLRESIAGFVKRISHYAGFAVEELQVKTSSSERQHVLQKEGEKMLSQVKNTDYLVLLDETGEEFTSVGFATKIGQLQNQGQSSMVFIIGGAYGFHETVYKRANMKMALSKMTFPHQMVRLIFAEQLYRAFTILKNEKYHH